MWSAARGRRVEVNEKKGELKFAPTLRSRQNGDSWPPGGTEFHGERGLENLFEQFALINARGGTNAQTSAALHQHNLIGILRGEVQFVRHDDDGIAVLRREPPESIQQADLRGDIQVESGLIEQQKQRLLSQGAREDDALLFSTGNLIHPAVAEISGADLGQGVFRDQDIVLRFEPQRAAMGMAALQDEFPGACGEEQSALLLDHGNALRAGAWGKRLSDESVEQNPSGQGGEGAGDQMQQGGFTAGVWSENSDDFARPGLKTCRFQREKRGLRGICRIGVTDLFDAQAYFVGQAVGFGKMPRVS